MDQNRQQNILVTFLVPALFLIGLAFVWFGYQSDGSDRSKENEVVQQPTAFPQEGVFGENTEKVRVTRVVDGDTIEIEGGQKVRYIGVDTPETVDPRREVACFGKEASNENKQLVEGKMVYMSKDVTEVDRYGRLLRYVYLIAEDGGIVFVNDYLIRNGFAQVLTIPPNVKYTEQFAAAQQEAREGNRGLWGACAI